MTLTADGYESLRVPVTVTAPSGEAPGTVSTSGTLAVSGPLSGAPGTAVTVIVRASDSDGDPVSGLSIRLSAAAIGTLARTSVTTSASGIASTELTLSSTPGASGFVRASATGYTDNGGRRFSVSDTTAPRDPAPPPPTGRTPSRISISGLTTHSGAVDTPLELPLTARVLDASGVGVANARVTFRVRQGDGQLSDVGNGRGIVIFTDRSGYARAAFTPRSAGTITVEATVRGVTQKVTFIINTGSAPPTDTPGTGRQYKVGDRLPGNLSGT